MARVTREDFFTSAFAVLAESGFPSVTAASLCQRLGVTRGSFYHHFDSFDDFLTDLCAYWRLMYTDNLVAQVREAGGPLLEQLRTSVHLAASLPHDTEIGLRAWGAINPKIHDALHEVDELRAAGLAASLREFGLAPDRASRYSRLSLAALVGAQMMKAPLTEEYLNDILGLVQQGIAEELHRGSLATPPGECG